MNVVKKQIAYNHSKRNNSIRYIVVHDTGNPSVGADAEAHFNYFNGGDRNSSADIFVDDKSAWIVNDYRNYYSWHCGDGRGRYGITNSNSVGVEMCINMDGNRKQAILNTAEVVRELMKELDVPSERVIRHYDASRKNCPQSMSDNNWSEWYEFKKLLEEELTMSQYEELKNEIRELAETVKLLATELHNIKNPMIYNYIDDNMPEWARASVRKAVEKGIIKGDDNGLNLNDMDLRHIVWCDRAGMYE